MDYTVLATDIKIQVYERGKKESDTLLVFLHGGPGSGAQPLMVLSSFQALEQEYHCIYFDQRGCGASFYDLRKGLYIAQLCDDVHVVIEDSRKRWSPDRIVLWGGSFGGMLASEYMLKYGRVDGLILSSPAVTFQRSQALAFFQKTKVIMEERFSAFKIDTCSEHVLIEPEAIFSDPIFLEFIFSDNNPSNSLNHIAAMSSWFYHYDANAAFQSLCIPVLIMIGQEDAICDASIIIDELAYLEKENITAYCFSPCGHAVFEDCEEYFVKYIQKFLSEL